jgi:hypothetical protein
MIDGYLILPKSQAQASARPRSFARPASAITPRALGLINRATPNTAYSRSREQPATPQGIQVMTRESGVDVSANGVPLARVNVMGEAQSSSHVSISNFGGVYVVLND